MAMNMPVAPSEDDREAIEMLTHALERSSKKAAQITLGGPHPETFKVPQSVFEVLKEAAEQMARGRAINIVPMGMLVTTQQTAAMLGVSRPHVIELIKSGEIPHVPVGSHRRIRIEDVLAFIKRREQSRYDALQRLSERSERLKLDF